MNESDIGNNISSGSHASVDEYLASIRNRNSSNNNNNNYDFEIDIKNISDEKENVNNLDVDIKIEIEEEEETEASINKKILENVHAIRPKKKKKKSIHKKNKAKKQAISPSLFNPEKYQNEKSLLTEQQEKWIIPTKKKSKKDIDEMIDRLSKPSPHFDEQIPENLVQKKPSVKSEVFNHLYETSTNKEKNNEERRIKQEKEREEHFLHSSPKSNAKSQLLAEKMLLRFVEKCFNTFPKDQTITASQHSISNLISNESQNEINEINSTKKKNENNQSNENQNNDSSDLNSSLNENNDCYFKSELSQDELDKLLILLGLRSRRENMPKYNKILFEKMNDWVLKEKQDGSRIYDANKIHAEMIHVIKEGEFSLSQFDRFARQRIIIELSNSKQLNSLSKSSIYNNTNTETLLKPTSESLNENDESEMISSKTIHYKSLIRLSKSKKINYEPTRNIDDEIHSLKIRPRPKFMMNPYSEELEPAYVSAKTEKIFRKSEVANIPFVERDQFFTEKRRKMIEKMSNESNKSQLKKFENKPKFSKETINELKEYKEKKEIRKKYRNDEPTYHPKIMNYETYKNTVHKKMIEKKVRPEGWDNDIARHRVAYQKYLQEKLAKEKDKEPEFDMMDDLDIVSKYNL